MRFEVDSGGEKSADSLGERRRFRKNLTRRNRNGASRVRTSHLTTLLSFRRGCNSLSVGGGGLGGHGGGGSPVGVLMTGDPSQPGGVLSFLEFLRFPGVGVFLGERHRVAI